jgi:plasmid stability protein
MATIQIRNVPDEVATICKVRAAKAGKSLQEYMLSELIALSERSTVDELYAELEASRTNNNDLTAEDIVSIIHQEREARTAHKISAVQSASE